jgi:triosephosphate isomerase
VDDGAVATAPVTLAVSLKLYLGIDETVRWARAAVQTVEHPAVRDGRVRVVLLPSLPAIPATAAVIGDAPIALGAQDLFWEDRGAYTGGVSGADLAAIGCTHVEVGHAERRTVWGEDAETIRRKFAAAVRNGLTPILCVGETERGAPDAAAEVVLAQLDRALGSVASGSVPRLVVAYEPEWAIGQAEPAPADHVVAVTQRLREHVAGVAGLVDGTVIYGGSASPGLLGRIGHAVDGLFLGRFAHDPRAFAALVDEAAALR